MDNDNRKSDLRFATSAYKRSRAMYMAQCTFEYFVNLCISDAFLAKLLTHLGISDSLIGIIASFVNLAFLFQLLTVFAGGRITNYKRTVITIHSLSMTLYLSLYLLPFLDVSAELRTTVVVGAILVGQIGMYFVSSYLFKWANGFVHPERRGSYASVKEMISLISGIVFTLIVGAVVDRYESLGSIEGGFLFISVSIAVLALCNLVSLLLIKGESQKQVKSQKIPLTEIVKNTLGNRCFRNVIILSSIYNVAKYASVGFFGTFKTNDLLYSVAAVQIINMAGNIGRFAFSLPFGKYSDRHSFVDGMKLAYIIEVIAIAAVIFATPSTRWCIIIYTVLHSISLAGSNANSLNITYSYIDEKYFVYGIAIKNSISGLLGFLSSLVAGRLLSYVQENGNTFLGIHAYGQQILSVISVIIMIGAIVFLQMVVKKQPVLKQ